MQVDISRLSASYGSLCFSVHYIANVLGIYMYVKKLENSRNVKIADNLGHKVHPKQTPPLRHAKGHSAALIVRPHWTTPEGALRKP